MIIKENQTVEILTTDNRLHTVTLTEEGIYTRNGIEGYDEKLKGRPLTFFPYTNIIKITKHNPEV